MTRFATLAVIGLLSTATAGVAIAGPGGGGGGPGRLAEALGLDEEQTALFESFKAEMKEAKEEVKEAKQAFRSEMKEQMASGDPNVKQLERLAEAKLSAERDATFLAIEHMAELSESLTDEQLEKLAEIQEQRAERREQRGENGPPHGRGQDRGSRGDF